MSHVQQNNMAEEIERKPVHIKQSSSCLYQYNSSGTTLKQVLKVWVK